MEAAGIPGFLRFLLPSSISTPIAWIFWSTATEKSKEGKNLIERSDGNWDFGSVFFHGFDDLILIFQTSSLFCTGCWKLRIQIWPWRPDCCIHLWRFGPSYLLILLVQSIDEWFTFA
jgi:hypothetical protein